MTEMTHASRREMMKKVQEADFFALELQLYLNTHPNCERALKLYEEAVKKAKALRAEYEERFGSIIATASAGKTPWQWSKDPWTWE